MNLPAILGGAALRPQGPPPWPAPDPEIRDVLERAHRDGWWGKYLAGQTEHLETRLREFFTIPHVLPCGSGNYAVELGLRALQIGPGDEVILADYDYPGNFLSIHAVGATPVLVEIDPRTWNLSIPAVRAAIGPTTKAILASHLHGGRVALRELTTLAREKGLLVLEDAAQATGACIDGCRAGTWGDVGVLSFGGSKLLSAGRGGALLTADAAVAQRARNHLMRAGNIVCPMSELQAALIVPQLEKLAERNALRWRNVQALCAVLGDIPGLRPVVAADEEGLPAFYKLGFQLDEERFALPRGLFLAAMQAEGFAVDEGFAVAHRARSPKRYRQGSPLAEASRAHAGCVQLHHPILLEGEEAISQLAQAIRRLQAHAALIRAKMVG
ncbi:MAG: aminotransferase class V-fold PLP-dependent enzyme [Planctomycetes bacterium]|nr:aminotransferase class V-fold PLP-dependent enzyme [Planctomycetota bacterium]